MNLLCRWTAEDVEYDADASSSVKRELNGLKPFTRYAFYVKAYSILANNDARSEIKFFVTKPGRPESIGRIEASAVSSSEIVS